MSVFQAADLKELTAFPRQQDQLAVVKRDARKGADAFFQRIMQTPLKVIGLKDPSILMRLDHASFWDTILKQQQNNIRQPHPL